MIKKLLFPFLLLLSACGGQGPSSDGYKFHQKQYQVDKVEITLKTHPTQKEMILASDGRLRWPADNKVQAYSLLDPKDPTKCVIHIVDPSVRYDAHWIGHEASHCFFGQWHQDNETH